MAQYRAFINREIRHVALTWEHPRDQHGEYIPLQDRRFLSEEYVAEQLREGHAKSRDDVEAAFMPSFALVERERMGIQAYETTTEGTPISPVYPDTPEGRYRLVEYCSLHQTVFADATASIQEWATILFGNDLVAVDIPSGTIVVVTERQLAN